MAAKKHDVLTMLVVTRKELALSRGQLASQCSHAAAECALKANWDASATLNARTAYGARKIVCEASSLDALKRLFGEAQAAGLVCYMVKDAGHTEIPAGTVTVVGIGPGPRRSIDSLTGSLSLVR